MADILLVEDNPADASLLMELMEDYNKNVKIEWVTDGSLALNFFADKIASGAALPKLMLLDLSLPRVSGYEVLQKLKGEMGNLTRVIVLSTSSNPMDLAQCIQLGAESYIPKPHDLAGYEVLVKRISDEELPNIIVRTH